jgi:hypothetical protein
VKTTEIYEKGIPREMFDGLQAELVANHSSFY